MTEQFLQKKILDWLKCEGAYARKIINANYSGVPDILSCYRSRFIAIETKVNGNKATKLQEYNLEQIRAAGGIAICTNDFDYVQEVLQQ